MFDLCSDIDAMNEDQGYASEEDVFGHLDELAFSPSRQCPAEDLGSGGPEVELGQPTCGPEAGQETVGSAPALPEPQGEAAGSQEGPALAPSPGLLVVGHQEVSATHKVLQKLGVVWCTSCGAFSAGKVARSLSAPCRGSTTRAGASVISRMARGLTPTSQFTEWPLRATSAPPEGRVVRSRGVLGGRQGVDGDHGQQDHEHNVGLPRAWVPEQGEGSHAPLPGCHSEGPDRRAPAEGQSAILGPVKGLSSSAGGRVQAQPELSVSAASTSLGGLAPVRAHRSSRGTPRNSRADGNCAGGQPVPSTCNELNAGAPVVARVGSDQPVFSDVSDASNHFDVYTRFEP